jgi:hypothetical protein
MSAKSAGMSYPDLCVEVMRHAALDYSFETTGLPV